MPDPTPIDISSIKSLRVEKHLGTGNWLIMLPIELPDLPVTAIWREHLHDYIGMQFARWVIRGIDRIHHHNYDPSWDSSGHIRQIPADPLLLLTRYETLSDWAENEHTGNSQATYTSGYGLSWDTYADELREECESESYKLLEAHFRANVTLTEEESEYIWEHPDMDDLVWFASYMEEALLQDALQGTTKDAWQKYEPPVRAEIAEQQRQSAIRQEKYVLVEAFWQTNLPEFLEDKIEAPEFEDMRLDVVLKDILADADPAIVNLMHEVGFPGHYSNSIKYAIKRIVSDVATSYQDE